MKSTFLAALSALSLALLTGCVTAPQEPIPLNLNPKSGRLGIVMSDLPKVDIEYPGAGCLLCLAAAAGMNSTLSVHTKTLPYEDLPKVGSEIAELIKKKGEADVVLITDALKVDDLPNASTSGPGLARKDFSALKKKYGVDKLLVVQVSRLGVERTYANYFPTSEPKAIFNGAGFIVDLGTNRYDWYLPVTHIKSADGKWDEPPKFPGLTNAYFQVIEMARDSYVQPFAK